MFVGRGEGAVKGAGGRDAVRCELGVVEEVGAGVVRGVDEGVKALDLHFYRGGKAQVAFLVGGIEREVVLSGKERFDSLRF